MTEYKFEIGYPITAELSLNELKKWRNMARIKKSLADETYKAMLAAKIPHEAITEPVTIWIAYNSRLDIDNHGYIAKAIIDAMRAYGLLQQDSCRYVRSLHQVFMDGGHIKVLVAPYKSQIKS